MALSKTEVHRRQRTSSGVLSEHDVRRIKWRIDQRDSLREIAKDYLVALSTIRAINRGDTWGWVVADDGPGNEVTVDANMAELAKRSQERLMAQHPGLAVTVDEKFDRLTAEIKAQKTLNDQLEQLKENK